MHNEFMNNIHCEVAEMVKGMEFMLAKLLHNCKDKSFNLTKTKSNFMKAKLTERTETMLTKLPHNYMLVSNLNLAMDTLMKSAIDLMLEEAMVAKGTRTLLTAIMKNNNLIKFGNHNHDLYLLTRFVHILRLFP